MLFYKEQLWHDTSFYKVCASVVGNIENETVSLFIYIYVLFIIVSIIIFFYNLFIIEMLYFVQQDFAKPLSIMFKGIYCIEIDIMDVTSSFHTDKVEEEKRNKWKTIEPEL